MASEGVVTIASRFGMAETIDRLKSEVASRGLTLFAIIDHAKNARDVGRRLSPATVLILGNAKAGTPLMQARQVIGIDLPLRVLVWQDAEAATWVSYNDMIWVARRYHLPRNAEELAEKIGTGLAMLVNQAAGAA